MATTDFGQMKMWAKALVADLSNLDFVAANSEDARLQDDLFRGLYQALQLVGKMRKVIVKYPDDKGLAKDLQKLWEKSLSAYSKRTLDDSILLDALALENTLRVDESVSEALKEASQCLRSLS